MSLPLDNYYSDSYVSSGNNLLNQTRESPDPTEDLWDVLDFNTLHSSLTLPSSIQGLGEKRKKKLWWEINVVTLHKLIKMLPWQMCAIIQAEGAPMKY